MTQLVLSHFDFTAVFYSAVTLKLIIPFLDRDALRLRQYVH